MSLVLHWQVPCSLTWVSDDLHQLGVLRSVDAGELLGVWPSIVVYVLTTLNLLQAEE